MDTYIKIVYAGHDRAIVHKLIATMTACTRVTQNQTSHNPSMDGEGLTTISGAVGRELVLFRDMAPRG